MIEEWKPVAGYEGAYDVSSLGRVRSNARVVAASRGGGVSNRKTKILTQGGKSRYAMVTLCVNGNHNKARVHALVANAFVPGKGPNKEINHIDHNPRNNAANNLEWVSHNENVRHSWLNDNKNATVNPKFAKSLTPEKVRAMRRMREEKTISFAALGEVFGVSAATARNVINRITWGELS